MSKSIKFKNNTFLDSSGIIHNRDLLSQLLEPQNLNIRLESQSYYSLPYSMYTCSYQMLKHITYIAFFLHVDNPSGDIAIFRNLPIPNNTPHWQFKCWETGTDNNTPLVIHILSDGTMMARNGVRGMNYFVQITYINI